ncbi:antitoxin component HigA of HigAB toxin-antitoxin module [Sphingomonas aerophila]|uniref:Antitoxin component HigA of HigAB toxin-antitoxin module n=1 Tax=Sphingomonas aerophila TaxID=1344948 RepID=A0A7W9BEM3_9SPHN|nr:antitoxin component HigA of HigAB toxin-antitoxin module [Sphingomonas aerophila]
MANYEAAARTLANLTGANCSIQQVITPRRKMPVRHIRIVVDAIIMPQEAFSALAA